MTLELLLRCEGSITDRAQVVSLVQVAPVEAAGCRGGEGGAAGGAEVGAAAGRAGRLGAGAGVSWPSLGGEVTGGSHHGQPQVPVPGHAPRALTGGHSCKEGSFSIQVNLFDVPQLNI